MVVTAGVDVGKASLDVSISEGSVVRFENTVKGIWKATEAPDGAGRCRGCVRDHRWVRTTAGKPVEKDRDCDARGSPEPSARVRESVRVRSQDRPAGRPGALTIRTGISGCTNTAA